MSTSITEGDRSGVMPDAVAGAEAVLASMSVGGAVPGAATFDSVRRASDTLLSGAASGPERTRRAAAVIVVLARDGGPGDAMRLADREARMFAPDGGAGDEDASLLFSAAAEAYVTAGDVRRSAPLATRALSYAERAGSDQLVFRANTLLAVSFALNGQYDDAERSVLVCREMQRAHGWVTGAVFYPLLLGELLVASSRLDTDRLRRIVAELRGTAPNDPLWAATATSTEAMALLAQNRVSQAIPLLLTVLSSTHERGILPMVRGFSLGIYADLLLAQGNARRALTLLEGHRSPSGHALCFDMQRSAAYLMLVDDRKALTTTEACIRLGPDHCLRTVPPLLYRRAVAQYRLGQAERADESFEEAFHLTLMSGSVTPLLTLPATVLLALVSRLQERHPDLSADAEAFRVRLQAIPAADQDRSKHPQLTPRESLLVRRLRDGGSIATIATDLQVSPNTVKSQMQTLYRKLGVARREDALDLLERAGHFD